MWSSKIHICKNLYAHANYKKLSTLPFREAWCLDGLAEGALSFTKSLLGCILVAAKKIVELTKFSHC